MQDIQMEPRTDHLDGRIIPGQTIGNRFVVQSFLGSGGMGEVWKAHDPMRASDIALKFLPAALATNPGDVQAFHESFKRIQGLHHQFICPALEFDRDPQVGQFLVMALAEGEQLRSHLRNAGRALTLDEAIRILTCIAEALDYAHQAGIVHRDVKPENIMVGDGGKNAMLLDFGIAAAVRRTTSVTGKGIGSAGTPAYMAPEQWQALKPSGKTDQYALGMVAYELLTGEPPFVEAQNDSILGRCHLEQPLPNHPNLTPDIFRVLVKACAKQPEQRFETCRNFVTALTAPAPQATRKILPMLGSAIGLSTPATPHRPLSPTGNNKWAPLVVWNVLGVSLFGTFLYLYWPRSLKAAPSEATAAAAAPGAAAAGTPSTTTAATAGTVPSATTPTATGPTVTGSKASTPTATVPSTTVANSTTTPATSPATAATAATVSGVAMSPMAAAPMTAASNQPRPDPVAVQAAKTDAERRRQEAESIGVDHREAIWKEAITEWEQANALEAKGDPSCIAKFYNSSSKFRSARNLVENRIQAERNFTREETQLRAECDKAKANALSVEAPKRARKAWKEAEASLTKSNAAKEGRKFDEARSLLSEATRQYDKARDDSLQAREVESGVASLRTESKDFSAEDLQRYGGKDWNAAEQELAQVRELEDWPTSLKTIEKMRALIPSIRQKVTSDKLVVLNEQGQYERVLTLLWPDLDKADPRQLEMFWSCARKHPQWFVTAADAEILEIKDHYQKAVALYLVYSTSNRLGVQSTNAGKDAWFRQADKIDTAASKADAQLFVLETALSSGDYSIVKERNRSVGGTLSTIKRENGNAQYYAMLSGLCRRAGLNKDAIDHSAAGMTAAAMFPGDVGAWYCLYAPYAMGNQAQFATQLMNEDVALTTLGLPLQQIGLNVQQFNENPGLLVHMEKAMRPRLSQQKSDLSFASLAYWSAAGQKELKDSADAYRLLAKAALPNKRRGGGKGGLDWYALAEVYLALGDLKAAIADAAESKETSRDRELDVAVETAIDALKQVQSQRELAWGLTQAVPMLLRQKTDRSEDVELLIEKAGSDPRSRAMYRNLMAYRMSKSSTGSEGVLKAKRLEDRLSRISALCGIAEGLKGSEKRK